mgnify:CR=1 FL=1
MNNFKNLLSSRRKELKMTQKELAEKLNVSDKTISKWETGASYPEITFLSTIAKVLEISINDLFGVEDMKEKELDVEEQESYDHDVIGKYKNKIFLTIGLIVVGIIMLIASMLIQDGNTRIMMLAIGFALYGLSLIYFISSNISFCSFYNKKFYTKLYDYVYSKYSSITIILFALPSILTSLLLVNSINLFGIMEIKLIIPLIIVIVSFMAIIKVLKISNFKIKNDIISKVLIIVGIILFITTVTNLLPIYFLPVVYILIFVCIFRVDYIK